MADPAGKSKSEALRGSILIAVCCSSFAVRVITSDGGLLAYRELDDVLGLTTSRRREIMAEARTGKNRRHLLVGLLRQSVFGRLGRLRGCERRRTAVPRPAMRWLVGGMARQFGVRRLCQPDGPLRDPSGWPGRGEPRHPRRSIWGLDRHRAPAASAEGYRAGHGFERKPNLRRTGG